MSKKLHTKAFMFYLLYIDRAWAACDIPDNIFGQSYKKGMYLLTL